MLRVWSGLVPLGLVSLAVTACHPQAGGGASAHSQKFDVIAAGETIRLVGTEPFWSGTITGGAFSYSTPDNATGDRYAVKRFAGLNGLGFSATEPGRAVDIVITAAPCSDGMSDRRFPFTAIVQIGGQSRQGCGWTDRQPYAEGAAHAPQPADAPAAQG